MSKRNLLLTVEQVGRILNRPRTWFYDRERTGAPGLKAYRQGRHLRFLESEINRYLTDPEPRGMGLPIDAAQELIDTVVASEPSLTKPAPLAAVRT